VLFSSIPKSLFALDLLAPQSALIAERDHGDARVDGAEQSDLSGLIDVVRKLHARNRRLVAAGACRSAGRTIASKVLAAGKP
jgi:hypothetical protein